MSRPTPQQLVNHQRNAPGAQVKTVDPIVGCVCVKGDIIPHPAGGWHVAIAGTPSQPVVYPAAGFRVGESNDFFHYSAGPSYGGVGTPQPSGSTFDAVASGISTDGRASLDGTTYGGATGAASGGVSNQSSGAGNSGGGGGSASRGF
jgi:hypothetical protein